MREDIFEGMDIAEIGKSIIQHHRRTARHKDKDDAYDWNNSTFNIKVGNEIHTAVPAKALLRILVRHTNDRVWLCSVFGVEKNSMSGIIHRLGLSNGGRYRTSRRGVKSRPPQAYAALAAAESALQKAQKKVRGKEAEKAKPAKLKEKAKAPAPDLKDAKPLAALADNECHHYVGQRDGKPVYCAKRPAKERLQRGNVTNPLCDEHKP